MKISQDDPSLRTLKYAQKNTFTEAGPFRDDCITRAPNRSKALLEERVIYGGTGCDRLRSSCPLSLPCTVLPCSTLLTDFPASRSWTQKCIFFLNCPIPYRNIKWTKRTSMRWSLCAHCRSNLQYLHAEKPDSVSSRGLTLNPPIASSHGHSKMRSGLTNLWRLWSE